MVSASKIDAFSWTWNAAVQSKDGDLVVSVGVSAAEDIQKLLQPAPQDLVEALLLHPLDQEVSVAASVGVSTAVDSEEASGVETAAALAEVEAVLATRVEVVSVVEGEVGMAAAALLMEAVLRHQTHLLDLAAEEAKEVGMLARQPTAQMATQMLAEVGMAVNPDAMTMTTGPLTVVEEVAMVVAEASLAAIGSR